MKYKQTIKNAIFNLIRLYINRIFISFEISHVYKDIEVNYFQTCRENCF